MCLQKRIGSITRVQTVPCVYPVELENQLKIAICANDMDKTRNCISRFHQYFRNEKVYTPKEVKECYVRFLWAFINIGKEVGCLEYQKLEQQKMLESIMEAKNHQELEAVSDSLTEKIRPASEDNKEVIDLKKNGNEYRAKMEELAKQNEAMMLEHLIDQ